MPQRLFSRERIWLFPPSLDEMIPEDHPVRFVAAFVDSLSEKEWHELGINPHGEARGAPEYSPRALLGIWLYGFMSGTRKSRKLEDACRNQIPYLWVSGWQQPDHNTLWRFYKEYRGDMRTLFKRTIKTAVKMDLIDLAVQAIDGTKIAANAAKDRIYDEEGLERLEKRVDEKVDELERQNEEEYGYDPVHLPKELRKAKAMKEKIKEVKKELARDEKRKKINLTDGDAGLMKIGPGIVPGYNFEAAGHQLKEGVAGVKGKIFTAADVVQDSADTEQLTKMIEQSQENLEIKVELSLADAGFGSGANLAECEKLEQKIVMPMTEEKAQKDPYHKSKFTYHEETDTYTCPEGRTLSYRGNQKIDKIKYRIYRINRGLCKLCPAFGVCTKSGQRTICRSPYEESLRRHQEWMETEEAKEAYKKRKWIIEPMFGITKEQMGIRCFWLRGLENVKSEGMMIATAFNLRTLYKVWQRWLSVDEKKWKFTAA
jgi:transposase